MAQPMKVISASEFTIGMYIHDIKESEHFFEATPQATQQYQMALRDHKLASGFGYTSLGALSFGIALALIDRHDGTCESLCLSTGQVISILSVALVFPITGSIGIIANHSAKRRLKKAAHIYNDHNGYTQSWNESIGLYLGISQHGLGFTLIF